MSIMRYNLISKWHMSITKREVLKCLVEMVKDRRVAAEEEWEDLSKLVRKVRAGVLNADLRLLIEEVCHAVLKNARSAAQ